MYAETMTAAATKSEAYDLIAFLEQGRSDDAQETALAIFARADETLRMWRPEMSERELYYYLPAEAHAANRKEPNESPDVRSDSQTPPP